MSYSYFDYLENQYEEARYEHYATLGWNGTYPPSQFVQPLDMDVINPPFFTFTVAMAILSILITIFVCHKLRSSHATECRDKIAMALTLICLILHLGENLASPAAFYYKYMSYHKEAAYWTLLIWDAFWCLTRISIYSVFIYRFYLVWQSLEILHLQTSKHKPTLFIFFAFILITQFTFWFFWMILFFGLVTFDDLESVTFNFMRIYWIFLALDICFIALLGFLLIKSIIILIKDVMIHAPFTTLSTMMDPSTASTNAIESTTTNTSPTDESATLSSARVKHVQDVQIGQSLINLATKIGLLLCVSMLSSSLYQFLWMISYEIEDMKLYLVSFTWSLDGVINMLCMYLSMDVASHDYTRLCVHFCKCHKLALRCIKRMVKSETNGDESDDLVEPEPKDANETVTLKFSFRSKT
eukprot:227436_1